MAENERQELLIERIQEDERLRGDLEDAAAKALVAWASERVAQAASDPERPDAEVEAEVLAIRAAARKASHSGESDAQAVIAHAEQALAPSQAGTSQSNTQQIAPPIQANPNQPATPSSKPAETADVPTPEEQIPSTASASIGQKRSPAAKPAPVAQTPKTIGAATPITGSLRRQLNDWIARRFPKKKRRR